MSFKAGKTIGVFSMLFPPDSEVGALRVGKLAQWLCDEHGWSAVVVKRATAAPKPVASKPVDHGVTQGESSGLHVISAPAYDSLAGIRWLRSKQKRKQSTTPKSASLETESVTRSSPSKRGLAARLSDLLVVPDSRQSWAWGAYRRMKPLVKSRGITALLSSGPPHSAHLAAYLCKRKFRLPWVIDLRDPWCANPYEQSLSDLAMRWSESLERRCFNLADVILANTEPARQVILSRYPTMPPSKVVTLPNGIDVEDYAGLVATPFLPSTDRPVLVHAGSLYAKRDPRMLFRALGAVKRKGIALPRFLFVGTVDAALIDDTNALLSQEQLEEDVLLLPPVSRLACLQGMLAADGLLLLGDSEPMQLQIPAKLFEYLYLQKPILSLFPSTSPVNPYLEDYAPFSASASPDSVEEITHALEKFVVGLQRRPSAGGKRPIQELFRSSQASVLHNILQDLL